MIAPDPDTIAHRATERTATLPADVDVIYVGPVYALVKWPGGYLGSGLKQLWAAAHVVRYNHLHGVVRIGHSRSVWNCSTTMGGDGRLTAKRKEGLIAMTRVREQGYLEAMAKWENNG